MKRMIRLVPVALALLAATTTGPVSAAIRKVAVPMPRVQQFIGTTRTLYVETGGDWYRARLARSCFKLPDADRIGIAMTATDLFDGSSTVIADGERCPVAYVTPSIGPPVELLLNPDG